MTKPDKFKIFVWLMTDVVPYSKEFQYRKQGHKQIYCFKKFQVCIKTILYFWFSGEVVWLWFLCTSITRITKAQVFGGYTILDGSRGHLPTSLWPRGRHLVPRYHGHWDGGRRTSLLQWATTTGHETHTRYAPTQTEEYTQSKFAIQDIPHPNLKTH